MTWVIFNVPSSLLILHILDLSLIHKHRLMHQNSALSCWVGLNTSIKIKASSERKKDFSRNKGLLDIAF